VTILDSDVELAGQSDIVFSVVPPRDAVETAQRIIDALPGAARDAGRPPLYFADLNAVAPSTCKAIAALFARDAASVRFVDGSIIGGPPSLRPAATASDEAGAGDEAPAWYRPLVPTSGPHDLTTAFPALAETLRSRHIGAEVGAASGLKMCFASMSKGYSAIATQAFATAQALGVLADLRWALGEVAPGRVRQTEAALTGMPPKAYRWVREMEEISATFAEEGGFAPDLFRGCAGVFRAVAEDTVLGAEKIGQRKRGRTAEDVAAAVAEGLAAKRKKTE